jgi:RNA polymerase sigma factor (sigma-70 family)
MASETPRAIPAEHRELFRRAKAGDNAALGELVEIHSHVLTEIASRYKLRGVSQEDLVSVARVGVVKNLHKARSHRSLAGFIASESQKRIAEYLRDKAELIHVPKEVIAGGKTPFEKRSKSLQDRMRAARKVARVDSLDKPLGEDGAPASSVEPDPRALEPHEVAHANAQRQLITDALRSVNPTAQRVLTHRYFGNLTPAQIAKAEGLTRKQVERHLAEGLVELKAALEKRA